MKKIVLVLAVMLIILISGCDSSNVGRTNNVEQSERATVTSEILSEEENVHLSEPVAEEIETSNLAETSIPEETDVAKQALITEATTQSANVPETTPTESTEPSEKQTEPWQDPTFVYPPNQTPIF